MIGLEGCFNFRDIGGYETLDGHRTAWNRVFRSASMDNLSEAGRLVLRGMGLKAVFDFRNNAERKIRPMAFVEDYDIRYWTRDHQGQLGNLAAAAKRAIDGKVDTRVTMMNAYRRMPYDLAPAISALFQAIADGDLPLAFNCAAGKDRTGVVAALLLELLAVPRETIVADYLVSGQFVEPICDAILRRPENEELRDLPRASWAPLVEADRAYLDAMFAVLEKRHGSASRFLMQELRLSISTLARVRNLMLVRNNAAQTARQSLIPLPN